MIIPDPIFKRAKAAARQQGKNFSELVTEAISRELNRKEQKLPDRTARFRITPVAMGTPLVDVSNRDELQRVMDGK